MGHYYAEMMCPTCGKVRCVCPLTKANEKQQVIEDKKRASLLKSIMNDIQRIRIQSGK